jgi:hypothetical protein
MHYNNNNNSVHDYIFWQTPIIYYQDFESIQ